ncbi:MAG TPA: hypothetical protein VNP36_03175 [Burkholderiales bacterium]|nr:hypothetical protein [Burkholderiales bacterium]
MIAQKPLFEHGLRQVRGYAHELWSDHNVHDPGITMLELLCYALSEIGYRAAYPIEDLVAARSENQRAMARQFPSARQALPNRPLTALDYRKLLIDVPGVRNAWVFPYEAPYYEGVPVYYARRSPAELVGPPGGPGMREVRLRGLFGARIEYARAGATPAETAAIDAAAWERLNANRNLCEEFVRLNAIEEQPFILCAEIELAPNAEVTEAHARILLAVQRYLKPGVRRYGRDEMLKRGRTDPELFDGPALEHGFIDEAELAQADLLEYVQLSDVISEVMDVEGVRAVREIVVRAKGDPAQREDKWEIPVQPGRRASLDAAGSRLVFYKGGMALPSSGALARFEALWEEAERALEGPGGPEDAPIPLGRFRNPAAYESVQQHFPAAYGIGEAGLPAGASLERRAQAKQLQGYLLFFDQLMANALAQLASAWRLLAPDAELEQSYFCQPVESFPDFRDLYPPPDEDQAAEEAPGADDPTGAWRKRINRVLHTLAESPASAMARRNRFLDHLMARFAERLQDPLAVSAALFGATPAALARAKSAFVAQLPQLGSERSLAWDITKETGVSGLERRLAHLLGLGALAYEIYQERDQDDKDEYRFRVRRRGADGVLMSSTTRYATREAALAELEVALAAAADDSGYHRQRATDGRHYFDIVDASGEEVARRIQYFRTAEQMEQAIAELKQAIAERHGERLCVIENILLRPEHSGRFLRICAEPGCAEDCPGDDPYSYRLHLILPAAAPRFADMAYRRFAEDLIRQETPAHLAPKICWVSNADLARIEAAWRAWRELIAGRNTAAPGAKFDELKQALESAKNVYPRSRLADCDQPDRFVLGRSTLREGE